MRRPSAAFRGIFFPSRARSSVEGPADRERRGRQRDAHAARREGRRSTRRPSRLSFGRRTTRTHARDPHERSEPERPISSVAPGRGPARRFSRARLRGRAGPVPSPAHGTRRACGDAHGLGAVSRSTSLSPAYRIPETVPVAGAGDRGLRPHVSGARPSRDRRRRRRRTGRRRPARARTRRRESRAGRDPAAPRGTSRRRGAPRRRGRGGSRGSREEPGIEDFL